MPQYIYAQCTSRPAGNIILYTVLANAYCSVLRSVTCGHGRDCDCEVVTVTVMVKLVYVLLFSLSVTKSVVYLYDVCQSSHWFVAPV